MQGLVLNVKFMVKGSPVRSLVPPQFNQRGVTQNRVSMMKDVGFVFNKLILGCTGPSLLCSSSL